MSERYTLFQPEGDDKKPVPIVDKWATNLPLEAIDALAIDEPLTFVVTQGKDLYGVQVAKTIDNTYPAMPEHGLQFVAITPQGPIPEYKMNATIAPAIDGPGFQMRFNVRTRIDGELYPPFNAGIFLPWAFRFYSRQHDIQTLTAEWRGENDSINFEQYLLGLRKKFKGNRVMAAQNTWTGKQFKKLGFGVVSAIREFSAERIAELSGGGVDVDMAYIDFKRKLTQPRIVSTAPWSEVK